MKLTLSFPRQERLKSRKSIDAIFRSGKRVHVNEWRAIFQFRPSPGIQVGVGAPSRNFKKAVDRNRIKRLLREAYRLDQHHWKASLIQQQGLDIFFLFTGKTLPDLTATREALSALYEKIFTA
ncbi:MAG: ribonuclease P protein component [Bacteroidota bacterium]